MSKNKTKALGKAVIVLLSIAIVVFLLLPFLDSSASDGKSGNSKGKKAIAQIFTSNPLTDLAKKIFAMFKKENPQQKPQSYAYAESEDFAEWTAEQRAAAEHDAVAADASETTSVDANFNYSEGASMIDEDGEWILVRQTTPEASQKGMHDITSKESAYDRLVRQERAAKYTGKATDAAGPAIPDSKWARLWKPIKNFFGGEDEASAPQTPNTERFMLASADSGFGSNAFKRGRIGKPTDAQIPGRIGPSFGNMGGDGASLSEMMDLDLVLDRTRDALLENAKKTLKPEQYKNVEKEINNLREEEHRKAEMAVAKQIADAAANTTPVENLIEKTFSAGTSGSSSLYNNSNMPLSSIPSPLTKSQKQLLQIQNLDKIRTTFDVPGFRQQPKILAVMGKAEQFNPKYIQDANADEETKLVADFYQILLEQNKCSEQDCVWVMVRPALPIEESQNSIEASQNSMTHLQDSIEAAGFQPVGSKTGEKQITARLMAEFAVKQYEQGFEKGMDLSILEQELETMKDSIEEDGEFSVYTAEDISQKEKEIAQLSEEVRLDEEAQQEEWNKKKEELDRLPKNYYPLPVKEFKELIAAPKHDEKDTEQHGHGPEHKEMPFILGNARVINELVQEQVIEHPTKVIIDTENKIMDVSQTGDDYTRSQLITDASIETFIRNKNLIDNAAKNLTSQGSKIILHYNMENEREALQNSAGKSADEIMGL